MSRRQNRDARFVEWLLEVLDQQRSPDNAFWLNKKERIFAVRWVNAKCRFWTQECIELFKLWRDESPRTWRPNKEDEKQMKTNFRMNLKPPNFLDLTDKHDMDNFKVFKVNITTIRAGRMEQDETFKQPAKTCQRFLTKSDPSFNRVNNRECLLEFYQFSNDPTGTMPPMSDDPYTNNWMNSVKSTNEPSLWNNDLQFSNTSFSEFFNPFFDQHYSNINQLGIGLPFNDEDIINKEMQQYYQLSSSFETTPKNYDPQQATNKNNFEDCLIALETTCYPGCIPELLPNISDYNPSENLKIVTDSQQNTTNSHQENLESRTNGAQLLNPETLRHSVIPSPTDSGFIERSSTESFSSVWSNCDGINFEELCPTLPQHDSVFE